MCMHTYINNHVHSVLQTTEREREQTRKEETSHTINKINITTASVAYKNSSIFGKLWHDMYTYVHIFQTRMHTYACTWTWKWITTEVILPSGLSHTVDRTCLGTLACKITVCSRGLYMCTCSWLFSASAVRIEISCLRCSTTSSLQSNKDSTCT